MATYRFAASLAGLGLLALAACSSPTEALPGLSAIPGIDLGPSNRVPMAMAAVDAEANVRRVSDRGTGPQAVGTVNAIDPAQHRLTLTHEPIPSIGWPSMTMDFPVAPSVDLGGVKPGDRVDFGMEKGANGMYEIRSVRSVGSKR